MLCEEEEELEAMVVCGEAYQLIGAIATEYPDLIPEVEKWLDNLSQAKWVHQNLLPVMVKPNAA